MKWVVIVTVHPEPQHYATVIYGVDTSNNTYIYTECFHSVDDGMKFLLDHHAKRIQLTVK